MASSALCIEIEKAEAAVGWPCAGERSEMIIKCDPLA
jgi:hypothetical protein